MRIGGDLEAMDRLKSKFDQQSAAVESLMADLQSQVNTIVQVSWEGPRANEFASAWNDQFKPALTKLKAALGEAAREVAETRRGYEQVG